jgi:hypothetical protein
MTIVQKNTANYTSGRTSKTTKIVMHWMVGTLASTDATFANPNSKVSAHYGIENGNVHQYVNEADTAWHAMSANSYSIGIEHSAAPGRNATASTVETSAQLLAMIAKRHNIKLSRSTVIKHSEVVATQCPGTIPIDQIIKRANQILKGEQDMLFKDAGTKRRILISEVLGRDRAKAHKDEWTDSQTKEYGNMEYSDVASVYWRSKEGSNSRKAKDAWKSAYDAQPGLNAEISTLKASNIDLKKQISVKPKTVTVEVPVEKIVIKKVNIEDSDRTFGDLISAAFSKLLNLRG